jgi:hypothetical protein
MRRFESDADVREHFAFLAELGPTPEPPPELWEQMSRARRALGIVRAQKFHPPSQPDLAALALPEIKTERKTHPIRIIERLDGVPDVHPWHAKTYRLKTPT